MKVTIDVPLPTHIWEARINIPNQTFSREHQESRFFYNEDDARKYLLDACRHLEKSLIHKCLETKATRFYSNFEDYDYDFAALDKHGFKIASFTGMLYKRSVD